MAPDDRELLNKIVTLSEENNKILRGMRRSARWSAVFRIVYWVLIIGLSFGAYVAIQPYVKQLEGVYKGLNYNVDAVKGVTSKLPDISNLFK